MMKIIFLALLILTFFSCNWFKEEGEKIADRSKSKVKEVWDETVDGFISSSGAFESTNFEQSFGENHHIEVVDVEGVRNARILNFYEGFLVYKGKKDKVLNYFVELETSNPELSDDEFEKSNIQLLEKRIDEVETKDPDLSKELELFKNFRVLRKPSVHSINKYPLTHTLVFDDESDTIYHYYENYVD